MIHKAVSTLSNREPNRNSRHYAWCVAFLLIAMSGCTASPSIAATCGRRIQTGMEGHTVAAFISPHGTRIAVAQLTSTSVTVGVIDLEHDRPAIVEISVKNIMQFLDEDHLLVTVTRRDSDAIFTWTLSSNTLMPGYPCVECGVFSVSPSGSYVSSDQSASVITARRSWGSSPSWSLAVNYPGLPTWSPDGELMAFKGNGDLWVVASATGTPVWVGGRYTPPTARPIWLNGSELLIGTDGNDLARFDVRSGLTRPIAKSDPPPFLRPGVLALDYAPKVNLFALVNKDHEVYLVNGSCIVQP